jgi:hypothetical protein
MKLVTTAVPVVEPDDEINNPWSALQTPESFGEHLQLKSFQRVFERIAEKEMGKMDIIVPFSDLVFVEDTGSIDVKNVGRVHMSHLAFTQLCTRLRIPPDYMERCPLSLRNSNLSYWVEQNDERKVMLRIRKFPVRKQGEDKKTIGVLRAVLPQTYDPIDNVRIIDWIGAALDAHKGSLGIQSAKIGEVSTHIRLLFSDGFSIGDSDPRDQEDSGFYYGVHISDSEVGERGFAAYPVTFRPVVETGFLHTVDGEPLVAQRHIHIDFKSLKRDFSECFAAAKENVETVTEQWQRAVDTPISEPHSYIRKFIRHHRLTNDFAESVIVAFDAEPVRSKFGIALALSRAATKLPIDMRVDTESLIGGYLAEGA